MMSFYLTCALPEQECCVSDLALTKNIGSTMMHGQQTEQKSLRRSSRWLPMRWIPSLTFMTKKISLGLSTASSRDLSLFLSDGAWRGYPFPCKNVLITLTARCCWEVHATRADPTESLSSLHQVAKCTMKLAVYLAKEVAAILRAVLTHDTKKLYDEGTVHLLCSNYWIQPIYQELLHSSSRYNATRAGERNRAWPVLLRTLIL